MTKGSLLKKKKKKRWLPVLMLGPWYWEHGISRWYVTGYNKIYPLNNFQCLPQPKTNMKDLSNLVTLIFRLILTFEPYVHPFISDTSIYFAGIEIPVRIHQCPSPLRMWPYKICLTYLYFAGKETSVRVLLCPPQPQLRH